MERTRDLHGHNEPSHCKLLSQDSWTWSWEIQALDSVGSEMEPKEWVKIQKKGPSRPGALSCECGSPTPAPHPSTTTPGQIPHWCDNHIMAFSEQIASGFHLNEAAGAWAGG